jgi:hypothetical protein
MCHQIGYSLSNFLSEWIVDACGSGDQDIDITSDVPHHTATHPTTAPTYNLSGTLPSASPQTHHPCGIDEYDMAFLVCGGLGLLPILIYYFLVPETKELGQRLL